MSIEEAIMTELEQICSSVASRINRKHLALNAPILVEKQKELIVFGRDLQGIGSDYIIIETDLLLGLMKHPMGARYVQNGTSNVMINTEFYLEKCGEKPWARVEGDIILHGLELVHFGRQIVERNKVYNRTLDPKLTDYSVNVYTCDEVDEYFRNHDSKYYISALEIFGDKGRTHLEYFRKTKDISGKQLSLPLI